MSELAASELASSELASPVDKIGLSVGVNIEGSLSESTLHSHDILKRMEKPTGQAITETSMRKGPLTT